jgi:hypothetical protein
VTFTVVSDRWNDILWAEAKIGDYTYYPNSSRGFTVQWLRNGSPIPGATNPEYELTDEDVGKKIKAEIKGYGQTKHSEEHQIDSIATVEPTITIEYDNHTTRSSDEVWRVMQEIEDAYRLNLANCKDAIASTGKQDNWMIELCESKEDRSAKIEADGKLHIYFSMRYYDDEFLQHDRGLRLSYIGEELRYQVVQMVGLEDENTEDLEEGRSIRRGKLAWSQPKTRADSA